MPPNVWSLCRGMHRETCGPCLNCVLHNKENYFYEPQQGRVAGDDWQFNNIASAGVRLHTTQHGVCSFSVIPLCRRFMAQAEKVVPSRPGMAGDKFRPYAPCIVAHAVTMPQLPSATSTPGASPNPRWRSPEVSDALNALSARSPDVSPMLGPQGVTTWPGLHAAGLMMPVEDPLVQQLRKPLSTEVGPHHRPSFPDKAPAASLIQSKHFR